MSKKTNVIPASYKVWDTYEELEKWRDENNLPFAKNYFHVKIHYEEEYLYLKDRNNNLVKVLPHEEEILKDCKHGNCYIVEFKDGKIADIIYDTTNEKFENQFILRHNATS